MKHVYKKEMQRFDENLKEVQLARLDFETIETAFSELCDPIDFPSERAIYGEVSQLSFSRFKEHVFRNTLTLANLVNTEGFVFNENFTAFQLPFGKVTLKICDDLEGISHFRRDLDVICVYHSKDLDGYSSGALVKKRYPEARLIGYDYGEEFPWELFYKGVKVIMIDVSLPMRDMYRLAEITGWQLTWVDHHVSAISDYRSFIEAQADVSYPAHELQNFLTPVLEVGRAACEIGWDYFFPGQPMPLAILLLGQYDTWRNEDKVLWEDDIMPFQYGMREICSSAETFPVELLTPVNSVPDAWRPIDPIMRQGASILSYQKSMNKKACKNAFEFEFEGLRAIALNIGGANSTVFDSVWDPEKHDVMIPFHYTAPFWKFSLYTTKDIDLSIIAKRYGGGGHAKACGFQIDSLDKVFKNFPL